MQRDVLLLTEILDAGERIVELIADRDSDAIDQNRDVRDALLGNFTVLGEAAAQ